MAGKTEISLLEEIRSLLDTGSSGGGGTSATKATGDLQIFENTETSTINGTIADAKHISIFVKSGTGTVQGKAINEQIGAIDFPFLESSYNDVTFTVSPNSTFIVLIVDGSITTTITGGGGRD